VKHVGRVVMGPDLRRGIAELDGRGETVGAVVIMRSGEDALSVIERVRAKIREIEPSLPSGVKIVTTYDRGELIERSVDTLKEALTEELIVVSLVVLFLLWHFPSAGVPILTIAIAVIISFIPMYGMNLTANIMSLAGIAIAIGAMVDASIVIVEQTHKKLERWEAEGRPGTFKDVVIAAHRAVSNPSGYRCCRFNTLMPPSVCQATASSRRSSPQNTSPRVTNVGTPKMFSLRASSVAASYALLTVSDRANGTTRAGSCPISTRLSERFGSPPASVPSTNQRRYVART